MSKLIGGAIALLFTIIFYAFSYWNALETALVKLRSKGVVGIFIADFITSRAVLLALIVTAIVLFTLAFREFRATRLSQTAPASLLTSAKPKESPLQPREVPEAKQHMGGDINITVSPHIGQPPVANQSQTQRQVLSQQQENKPPILEPVEIGTRIEKALLNVDGELAEKSIFTYDGDDLGEVNIAFAELFRGVDGSTEPWVDVRALILFFGTNDKELFRIREAHWRKAKGKHSTFRTGDSDELIIAVVGDDKVWPYAGRYETVDSTGFQEITAFQSESRNLEGNEFYIKVVLIGKRGGTTTLNQTFDYALIAAPEPTFKLREG
jgi:hypothetical protein